MCVWDLGYFDVRANTPLILGAAFLAANSTAVQLDGYTGILTLYTLGALNGAAQTTFRWLGMAIAMATVIGALAIWLVNPWSLTFTKFWWAVQHQRQWPVEGVMMWASALLALTSILSVMFSWLGLVELVPVSVSLNTLGPDVLLIASALTCYVGIQLVLHVILVIGFDLSSIIGRNKQWNDDHGITYETAWARHLLHVTLCIAVSMLALIPLVVHQGLIAGSDFVLTALVLPLALLILFHGYYVTGGLIAASWLPTARPRFKVRRGGGANFTSLTLKP